MTKALEKEIEEFDNEEAEVEQEAEANTEETTEEDKPEDEPESDETESEEETTEDEIAKKQEAYRERQKKRQEDQAKRQDDLQTQASAAVVEEINNDEISEIKEELAIARQERQIRQYEQSIKQAGKELEALETPFKEAFTDYDDVVSEALELSKLRMMKQGVSENEANAYLDREKVLLADRAASQGKDPVEAVYQEAKDIVGLFEDYAERKGYVRKDGKPKTNLQAMREMSKPNAMSGGAGKGATATKKEYDDLDLEQTKEVTLGQMLKGEY